MVVEILDIHDALGDFVAHTLEELPSQEDPWVELAPIVAITRAAFDEAADTLRINRMVIDMEEPELDAMRETALELRTISRTLHRQIHLLARLFVDRYSEDLQRYLGLARSLEQHAIYYMDFSATVLGDGAPF